MMDSSEIYLSVVADEFGLVEISPSATMAEVDDAIAWVLGLWVPDDGLRVNRVPSPWCAI